MITKGKNALIFYQMTHSVRKCKEISLKNLYVDMRMRICLWLKGLRQCHLIKSSFCFHHFKPVLLLSYHIPGKSYWSKDIIFLVTDKDQLGMQAWLDAYHGISNSCKYPRA